MYVKDIRKEFYDIIAGERCVIFVNFDLDAICACKILQTLFKCDNIVYTIIPIKGVTDFKKAYAENCSEVEYFILLNCGGTVDILEVLEPDERITFFIIDSHRPIDVCNIYSNKQICVISESLEDVPDFDDIFRDDSDEEDEEHSDPDEHNSDADADEDDTEDPNSKRQRLIEEKITKRRTKRLWEENRDKLMFEYSQFSYYGKSIAIILFELAWRMSKDNSDLLWWAIVGITEQLIFNKIENQDYVLACQTLQEHVSRLTRARNEQNVYNHLKITYEKDLRLALYRHWTVESSLKYSVYTSCQLRLWTLRGEARLFELLADMGLPLAQTKQNFNAMDLVLRKEFNESIEKYAQKYAIDNITYGSFVLQYGYRMKYCASDFVYSILGVLETTGKERNADDCFLDAMDFVSSFKKDSLDSGIEKAKKILSTIFKLVQYTLDMRLVYVAGPFIYLEFQEGNSDVSIFSQPHCLSLLAHFTLNAYVAISKSKKTLTLPLICTGPMDPETHYCVMVGIPPISEDSPKNFFGKAFEKAAANSQTQIDLDYFDTSVVRILAEDRSKFVDALIALLS